GVVIVDNFASPLNLHRTTCLSCTQGLRLVQFSAASGAVTLGGNRFFIAHVYRDNAMPTNVLTNTVQLKEPWQKQMKCLVKEDVTKDGLTLRKDVPEPALGFDDVKIKVLATAVCGTDKSIYHSGQNEGIRNEMQRYLNNGTKFKPIV